MKHGDKHASESLKKMKQSWQLLLQAMSDLVWMAA